ncbi:S-ACYLTRANSFERASE [Salix purpurea]|uniref:S-ACYLTRANSFERASE n=1 Tax=Salix purpurea TaxID=77065 RepID=A0A9Q0ZN46_SALPP|nr:S-ACYLTRANSFERASE [Salix purpurea]
MVDSNLNKEHLVTVVSEDHETLCWGCGLRLLHPRNAPVFKCGWCGAITDKYESKCDHKDYWWRRMRDRCFVCVLVGFILFVICGGVWAVYPVIFSISFVFGIFHLTITGFGLLYNVLLSACKEQYQLYWKLCWCNKSPTLHCIPCINSCQHNDVAIALASSAVLLSTRGLVLVYLFVSSTSLEIGISVLLWQQLCYIYEGQTYLDSLSMRGGDEVGDKDCKNLFRFFGCPYPVLRFLPNFWNSPKSHRK